MESILKNTGDFLAKDVKYWCIMENYVNPVWKTQKIFEKILRGVYVQGRLVLKIEGHILKSNLKNSENSEDTKNAPRIPGQLHLVVADILQGFHKSTTKTFLNTCG